MKKQPFTKLKAFAEKLNAKLQRKPKASKGESKQAAKEPQFGLEMPTAFAYNLLGDKNARFLPLFKDLDQNLQKSGLKVNFKAYVSLIVVASFLIALPIAAATALLLFLVFNLPLGSVLLFGVGTAMFSWVFSIVGFYLYPIYCADKHKRELEDELPFTTGYMSILATAGVSPEKMFHSLSNLKPPLAASSEATEVVKQISLFGSDIISALEKASSRTPSQKLRDMIEGMISAIHSGGNLGAFLRERFKSHMKLKRVTLKKQADSLSVLSEIYVALLLTGPLLFIIMLSVMSVLGGGGFAGLSSELLLGLLTYIGLPICALIFLIIVDSASPKW